MSEVQLLSPEDCQTILDNCFADRHVLYESHLVESLSGHVEGYMSKHFSVTVKYHDGDDVSSRKFFVKSVLSDDGFLGSVADEMEVFRKENFLYTELFPEFEKCEGFRRFAPRCYLAKGNILVLEDITEEGFHVAQRLEFFNLEQCRAALKTLARYHAHSIILEEVKSKELGCRYRLNEKYPDEFVDKFHPAYDGEDLGAVATFMKASLESMLELIDEIPDSELRDKEELKRLLRKHGSSEQQACDRKLVEKFRSTCVHGDLWASNVMFRGEGASPEDCLLVDFQVLCYRPPAFDVELFFYANTDVEFRARHKAELVAGYHEVLAMLLAAHGVGDVVPVQHLQEAGTLLAPEAKLQAVVDKTLLNLDKDALEECMAKYSDFSRALLVEQRSHFVLQAYRNNPKYRDTISEELIDLLHLLRAKEKLQLQP